ncbi:MAG TPA: CehA/McbA family metallohydrolase [Candidatus Methylomirabilis sp.]|nr:CehA/McbA family metallohydrolase [Candidatus Methylomirabilis sp.]
MRKLLGAVMSLLVLCGPAAAQRSPVLPQIDLPHPYYFREMYLPQLTSGPSSLSWSPDSKEVVYSMAGSLWRQAIDSREAQQITDGPGYDYQPDWSPDGNRVIYVSYQKDAMELWLLDLASGKTTQLTHSGTVNVEPRWSPDGKRIVFVSTEYNKRFHIFRADVNEGKLGNVVRLTGETKSPLPRYYYSPYDMEISPVWTRDGKEILFVSNRGHIYGTGGFWRMKAEPGAEAREIHYEETNWKARPDFSPDGSRMVYSSYSGGQWHNLWVMPAHGGDGFPLTYNGWDSTNVRWSPDGNQLAFMSNYGGAARIEFRSVPGGPEGELRIEKRNWLNPRGTIELTVVDGNGNDLPARVSVTDQHGRFLAPDSAWIHADDGFDRKERPSEAHYFYQTETATLVVPAGKITIEAVKGFEYRPVTQVIEVRPGDLRRIQIKLEPLANVLRDANNWISADLHVHMNYGGTYLNSAERLVEQAKAEGIRIVNNLVVNKERRFPDIASVGQNQETFDSDSVMIVSGQEYHTSYWGHRGLVGLQGALLLPGYAGYPNTAAASLYPMNADVYDMAHEQAALVGAVHPFDEVPDPFANPPQQITDELPVDVALGKLDYMEIVGFSDHKSTAAVWYKLLNLGFRVPAGAGTDATTDYAAPIRGQVGMDRVYAWVPEWPANIASWFNALKRGRTFATNGPLVEFTLDGQRVGDELKYEKPRENVPFTAKLRSIVPVDHLEIVCNGRVVQTLKLDATRESADVRGTLPLTESGWCALRTFSDGAEYPVLDKYAYATTSPVYVTIGGQPPRSPQDAKYFAAWIGRTIDVTSNYPDWNSAAEKAYVLKRLEEAKAIYEKLSVPLP